MHDATESLYPQPKGCYLCVLQAMDPHGSMNQERWGIRFDGWMTYEQLLALAPLLIAMALETTAPQARAAAGCVTRGASRPEKGYVPCLP